MKSDSKISIIINNLCNLLFFNIVQRALDNLLHNADLKHHIELEDSHHHKYIILSKDKYQDMVNNYKGKEHNVKTPTTHRQTS